MGQDRTGPVASLSSLSSTEGNPAGTRSRGQRVRAKERDLARNQTRHGPCLGLPSLRKKRLPFKPPGQSSRRWGDGSAPFLRGACAPARTAAAPWGGRGEQTSPLLRRGAGDASPRSRGRPVVGTGGAHPHPADRVRRPRQRLGARASGAQREADGSRCSRQARGGVRGQSVGAARRRRGYVGASWGRAGAPGARPAPPPGLGGSFCLEMEPVTLLGGARGPRGARPGRPRSPRLRALSFWALSGRRPGCWALTWRRDLNN